MPTPKYSLIEVERRWLVDPGAIGALEKLPSRRIEDRYLTDTRLRLRRMSAPDGETVYKLCKKYGKSSPHAEPITNLYLSEAEYEILAELPAAALVKTRYALAGGSLDLLDSGLMLFEKEFASEVDALGYVPPPFTHREVTGDPAYSGATLALGQVAARPIFELDGERISSRDAFYDELERVVIPGAEWGRSLDALHDILRGGFGTPEGGFDLIWRHHERSIEQLGQTLFDVFVEIIREHGAGGSEAEDGVTLSLR